MEKTTIIVCATAYRPLVGGAEIAIQEVARRLSADFDVIVLTARMSRRVPRRDVYPEARVVRLGWGFSGDKWLLPILIPFHIISNFEFRYSKFILWGMDISQGSLGAWAAKIFRPRTPFVFTIQYGESDAYLRHGRGGLIMRGFKRMLASADRVTAISVFLEALARETGYCGSAEVIPNGVDTRRFQADDHTRYKGQGTKYKTITTISRLVEKNGIDILIDAVAEVKKKMPDVRCVIVGDGPERKKIESRIKNHGLEGTVRMEGEVAHEKLPEYLSQADIFVRPSRSEGMGNAFVEAMAAGLPVIGTAVGGIPDIITHEKTGLLVRPEDAQGLADAMMRLLTDSGLASRIAAAGMEKARRDFDWDAIARRYAAIFTEEIHVQKRVLVATGLFPPEIGGPATYVKLLTDILPAHGIGLRVVPFRSVRKLPRIVRHLAYCIKLIAGSRGRDVIHAQDPVSVGMPALMAARLTGRTFVLKVVGDYAWEQYQRHASSAVSLEDFQKGRYDIITEMRRRIERFVAVSAHRVIVPSNYLKSIVVHWGVSEKNIAVVYNAFVIPRAVPAREEARVALGTPPDAFQIVSIGRLVPWKGFDVLIEAMALFLQTVPQARLVILGSGPEESLLRQKIADADLAAVVSLGGNTTHDDVLLHLSAGDLFILNSSYEGFSHTLLEALAMGIPVLVSDAGGNREIIEDGVNGRLYHRRDAASLADEIMRLFGDQKLCQQYAAAGSATLQRFSIERLGAATTHELMRL